MSTIPNTDNYTVPGGIKVFFNNGTGERDLGNIVGDSLSIVRNTDELEHFSNRSGTRLKDKIVTIQEAVQFDFNLDEIVIENFQYFFKGGSISNLGSSTSATVDQKETLTGEIFSSLEKPGLTLVTVRQYVDYVRSTFNGTTFTNNDVEADALLGVAFNGPGDTVDDRIYIGKLTKFGQVDFQVNVPGSYTGLTWEYWNGAWVALTTAGVDDFTADGIMTLTGGAPSDWALTTVDGVTGYFIRTTVASVVTTQATIDSIGHLVITENTDYKVDPGTATGINANKDGRVARISSGVLESGEQIKVNFTYTTFSSQIFDIAGVSTIEGSARVEIQPSSGRGTSHNINIPKAQLVSNGNMDLNDSEFQQIPMSLVVLDNSSVSTSGPFGTVQVFT